MRTNHNEEARLFVEAHPEVVGRHPDFHVHGVRHHATGTAGYGTLFFSTIETDENGQEYIMARKATIYRTKAGQEFILRDGQRIYSYDILWFHKLGIPTYRIETRLHRIA